MFDVVDVVIRQFPDKLVFWLNFVWVILWVDWY